MSTSGKPQKQNMIVRTHLAATSADQSTDMHSRPGKSTINLYKQFRNMDRKLPIQMTLEQKKQQQLLKALSFVPEKLPAEIKRAGLRVDMQNVLDNLKKQSDVDGPLANLEGNADLLSDVGEESAVKSPTQDKQVQPPAIEMDDFIFGAEQEEPHKFKVVKGQTSSFNAQSRDDPALIKKLHGESYTLGPIFYPNYKYIKRTFKSNVGLVDPDTFEVPREKVYKVPACQIKEGQVCSYKIRKAIKESMKPQNQVMAPIQELAAHREVTHAQGEDGENREKENLISQMTTPQSPDVNKVDNIYRNKLTIVPEEQRYEAKQKEGQGLVKLDKLSAKHSIFYKSPYPGDSNFQIAKCNDNRLDLPPINYEVLSTVQNTKQSPDMKKGSPRLDLAEAPWGLCGPHGMVKGVPDPVMNNKQEKYKHEHINSLNLGAIGFEKRSNRKELHNIEQSWKLAYDNDKIDKALFGTKNARVKCFVSLDKQTERGTDMLKIEKRQMKSFTRRIDKKDGLKFSDGIPNNMQPTRPGSGVSMSQQKVDREFITVNTYVQEENLSVPPTQRSAQTQKVTRNNGLVKTKVYNSGIFNYVTGQYDQTLSLDQHSPLGGLKGYKKAFEQSIFNRTGKQNIGMSVQHRNDSLHGKSNLYSTMNATDRRNTRSQDQEIKFFKKGMDQKSYSALVNYNDPREIPSNQRSKLQNTNFQSVLQNTAANSSSFGGNTKRGIGGAINLQDSFVSAIDSTDSELLQGSFLQFDKNSRKLVDISKQLIVSPRKVIVGESPGVSELFNESQMMNTSQGAFAGKQSRSNISQSMQMSGYNN